MAVLHILANLLGRIWDFLKNTLFSKKWWDRYYWIPVAFLVGVIIWILSGGRRSPSEKIVTKLNEIRKNERENIVEIEREAKKIENNLESEHQKETKRIQDESDQKLEEVKERLKEDHESMKDDSQAINDALNKLMD